ncbi:Ig-like domain-containing protein [Arthrobacter sp. fls2-241-R2A-200]|uniref:Ig-like domain-containing protein n=1 Tax=Arthrobacter sp. fls2-241-R2A-200 TaxID=3040281 RepID=UPI00254D9B6E|nr:Ig-like domain-containing protein [Arthrobacter sp. fls2-241-R2A-200]
MMNHFHLKAASVVAALLAAAMTVLGIGLLATPANAADIPGARISISTTSAVTQQWDQVDLTCEWSVPDNSKPGDTFSLQLPAELRWFGSSTFDLNNKTGQTVATAVANPQGLVVFTLTDFVATHPLNVGGACNFTTQYAVQPGAGGSTQLNFSVGSTVVRVPVAVNGPCTVNCDPAGPTSVGKAMWWSDPAQTELESIFYMPAMTSRTNDVVITDTPAAGMAIDCSRVTPRVGKNLNADGKVSEPYDDAQYPATVDCSPQKVTVSWKGLPKGEHVELFVVTPVTDASLDVYQNNGTVSIQGRESIVGAQTRRTNAGGSGDGTAAPTPTPTPSTATPTPAPSTATPTSTPSTSTPTPTPSTATPAPSTMAAVAVTTKQPSAQAPAPTVSGQLASTGAQGPGVLLVAAGLLAVGSLLAYAGARRARRRSH